MRANSANWPSTVIAGLVAAVLLAACSSSGSTKNSAAPPTGKTTHVAQPAPKTTSGAAGNASPKAAAAVVTIKSFAYQIPKRVDPGAKVTVHNMDQVAHTVTADTGDNVFNVNVNPGSSAAFTAPNKPGAYKFHCKYHSNMHAVLVVK